MAVNKQKEFDNFHVSKLPFLGWVNRFFHCVKIDTGRDFYYSRIRGLMAVLFLSFHSNSDR